MNNQTESQELDLALLKEVTMKMLGTDDNGYLLLARAILVTQFLQTGQIPKNQGIYDGLNNYSV